MLSGLSGLSGLSAVCGGASAFSPTQLSGYVNSPYNIALLWSQGKLWQNTAMTVAAVADGDPVRRIDCGGTYYDAPSDAVRPLLWDEGGGKWSLSFDGVDDYFAFPTVTFSPGGTVAWVGQRRTTSSYGMLLGHASALFACVERFTDGDLYWLDNTVSQVRVLDFANSTSPTAVVMRNASAGVLTGTADGLTKTTTANSANLAVSHFGRRANPHYTDGRVSALVIATTAVDDTQYANLLAYLNAL